MTYPEISWNIWHIFSCFYWWYKKWSKITTCLTAQKTGSNTPHRLGSSKTNVKPDHLREKTTEDRCVWTKHSRNQWFFGVYTWELDIWRAFSRNGQRWTKCQQTASLLGSMAPILWFLHQETLSMKQTRFDASPDQRLGSPSGPSAEARWANPRQDSPAPTCIETRHSRHILTSVGLWEDVYYMMLQWFYGCFF